MADLHDRDARVDPPSRTGWTVALWVAVVVLVALAAFGVAWQLFTGSDRERLRELAGLPLTGLFAIWIVGGLNRHRRTMRPPMVQRRRARALPDTTTLRGSSPPAVRRTGMTFVNWYPTRGLGIGYVAVALSLVAIALLRDGSSGDRAAFLFYAIVILVVAVGFLRSKVTVDQAGMHIRRTLGCRHLAWSEIVGFYAGQTWYGRLGRIHFVWVFRSHGRDLRPYALATVLREEAEARVSLLEIVRRQAPRGR